MSVLQLVLRYLLPVVLVVAPLLFISRWVAPHLRQRLIAMWVVVALFVFVGGAVMDEVLPADNVSTIDAIITRVGNILQPIVIVATVWILFRRLQDREKKLGQN